MSHKNWMQRALQYAKKTKDQDEVPVSAIIVKDDRIISAAHNQPISTNDPSAHAEIIALRSAAKILGNYRLPNVTLYVTLEPCAMCAGAIIHARVNTLVFGAYDLKTGACGSVMNLPHSAISNHQPKIIGGILEKECSALLKTFFATKRVSG